MFFTLRGAKAKVFGGIGSMGLARVVMGAEVTGLYGRES